MDKNYVDFLKKQPILEGLTETELFIINELAVEQYFDSNRIIIQENEESDDLYFLVKGEVEVLKFASKAHEPLLICKLQAGEIFGDMAFISNATRSSTIKTTQPCTILQLSKESLNNSIPSVFYKIMNKLANINATRLRKYYEKL